MKKYRPSNGTDGMVFMSQFCEQCELYEQCEISMIAILTDINEDDYPKEWIYGEDGEPTCTSFLEPTFSSQLSLDL